MGKPTSLHAPPERRTAIWPWLLMPLAALAIFLALRGVRNADPQSTGAAAETARSAPDQ
jgi:hypothetical protein